MSERMPTGAAPAFPIKCLDGAIEPGLTKREHFAAMALQGILASVAEATHEEFAANAVRAADALIAALAHQPVPAQGEV